MQNIKKFVYSGLSKIGYFIISLFYSALEFSQNIVAAAYAGKNRSGSKWVPKFSQPQIQVSRNHKKLFFGMRMFLLGIVFATLFIVIPSHIYLWLKELPNPDLVLTKDIPQPTRITDSHGRLLYEIFVEKRFEPVSLDKIPEVVKQATISVEDDRFYEHHGFDLSSMLRAINATIFEKSLQGGSTITQQLVKNVLLTSERTISRKMKELVLAVAIESKFSKDQILELYLNNISYGGSAWGIQSASQKFFKKNVWELDLSEASLLAGLPSSPTTYSPFTGDLELAKKRQKYVLDRMYQLGYITRKEADEAYASELNFAPQTDYIRAPHFVAMVRKELEEKLGKRLLEQGGLTVRTTIDLDLQDTVQSIVAEEVAKNQRLKFTNGAAVVVDPKTGNVLAYVGSIDYFKDTWGAFDVASAFRQPGSSIKPLTYALALEKGMTPASTIKDSPITYKLAGSDPYTPVNYDGKYHGTVTLRAALANSYNVPAVKLAYKYGPDNIVALGKAFGLQNWKVDSSYGLSVTLGGKEVRLLDHTNFYASLARGGVYKQVRLYDSIKDNTGFDLYFDDRKETRVISADTAYLIWHILSDNKARTPAFGSRSSLVIPDKTVAVKTGTTDSIRDNFTMGYTPSFAVGVWVGNNDNTPLDKTLSSGLTGAAPIWNRVMSYILTGGPNELMDRPTTIVEKKDDKCGYSDVFSKEGKIPSSLCDIKSDKNEESEKKKILNVPN